MWTYSAFIVATIVAFRVLRLAFQDSFLRSERAEVGLAIFMSFFWCLRLVTGTFSFRSDEWPPGEDLEAGHALFNAFFVFLTLCCGVVAVWGITVGSLSSRDPTLALTFGCKRLLLLHGLLPVCDPVDPG